MIIAIFAMVLLIGIIILPVIVFRRHSNGRLSQYGAGLKSLPVIEFNDEDKYGDELRAEIDEAYKKWLYGKEQYEIYKKVVAYKNALHKFVYYSYENCIRATDTGFNRTLDRAVDYEWGDRINMSNGTVKLEIQHCNEILDSIERKAKAIHGTLNTVKYYQ